MFANKIKQVQACIEARGYHFQNFNTFYKHTATFRKYCIWALDFAECHGRNIAY